MIDRDIYVCVKQKWNKKSEIFMLFFQSLSGLLHLINFSSSGK